MGVLDLFNKYKDRREVVKQEKEVAKQKEQEAWEHYNYGDGANPRTGENQFNELNKISEYDRYGTGNLHMFINKCRNTPLSELATIDKTEQFDGFEYRVYIRFRKLCFGVIMDHVNNNLHCDMDTESQQIKANILENLKYLKKEHPYLEQCTISRGKRGYYVSLSGKELNLKTGELTGWQDEGPLTMYYS